MISDGKIRIVVLILPAIIFITSHGLSPATAQVLRISDANGTKIGDTIGISAQGQPIIPFNLNGQLIPLVVTQDRFFGNTQLLFESVDCTGPRFLVDISVTPNAVIPVLFPPVVVAPPGNTILVSGPNSSQSITARSILSLDGTCQTLPQPFSTAAFLAQATIDLDTQFFPPFSMQLIPLP